MKHKRRNMPLLVAGAAITAALIGLNQPEVAAFPTYDDCVGCHGSFMGPMSPQGNTFPSDSKHTMHNGSGAMNTNCSLCHTASAGFGTVFIGSSDGTAINPGVGCTGCHGRDYGGGGTAGNNGIGLRAHHEINGISCGPCHVNEPPALPENVLPVYYGTADTACDEPCNENGLENWTLNNPQGLDNDGDNDYDANDSDCAAPCPPDVNGDGVVDVLDLLEVLTNWGPCPAPCPPDINEDGVVDVLDLLEVLTNWGPC